ncbi:DUF7519 family protein [Natrarchaeobius oligotrophus]|uniref:Uncharacterized protein n=1 Tax=Natrarchaeobius chitinivorans TaxID=1679083 RepID=A0A3N6MRV1_NATCH|nr:hypothetical protein [Natrarchaeobius chitinivorans]RQG97416.1 hypothetical protein EA472_19510 [Natrarchaeobius chitinivorans]
MSLAGPRLDRPSAIGDEGRPRATSLGIATLAVVVPAIAAGFVVGEPTLVTALATVVGLAVAGIALLERSGFVELFVGHAFVVTFGSAFALLVVIAPFFGTLGVAVSGLSLALFGVAMAWADVGGSELTRAVVGCGLTYGSLLCSFVAVGVTVGLAVLALVVLGAVTGASTPIGALAGFLLVAIGTGCSLALSLRLLPFRQLTPRSRRSRVERRLRTAGWTIGIATLGAFVLLVAVVGLLVAGPLSDGSLGVSILDAILSALSSVVVVGSVAAVGLASLLAGVTAAGVRLLTRRPGPDATRWSAAVAVGFVLVCLAVAATVLVFAGAAVGNPLVVVGVGTMASVVATLLLVGPIAFAVLIGAFAVGVALRLVPDRAGGPTLAAVGLVIAAIALSWHDPTLTFVCLAGSALVWDVSTYGLGLTAELGHLPETRRLELFHGLLSVAVAVGAVLVAIGLQTVRGGIAGTAAPIALVAVGVGALVLLLPLRG